MSYNVQFAAPHAALWNCYMSSQLTSHCYIHYYSQMIYSDFATDALGKSKLLYKYVFSSS